MVMGSEVWGMEVEKGGPGLHIRIPWELSRLCCSGPSQIN